MTKENSKVLLFNPKKSEELVQRVLEMSFHDTLSAKLMQLVVFYMGENDFNTEKFITLDLEKFMRKLSQLQFQMGRLSHQEEQKILGRLNYNMLLNYFDNTTQYPVLIDGFCRLIDFEFANNEDFSIDDLIEIFHELYGELQRLLANTSHR